MKTKYVAILAIFILLAMLLGCSILQQHNYPTEGIWYCEDLQMYLNMETKTGYTQSNGKREPLYIRLDHGRGIHVVYGEDEWEEAFDDYEVWNATFRYHNGIFELKDSISGENYAFVRIEEAQSYIQ